MRSVEPAPSGESEPPRGFQQRSARQRHLAVLSGALLVLGLALSLQVTPAGEGVTLLGWRLPETCIMRATTGAACPGCGLTRSFVRGARLDPEAFRFHPLGPLLLAALVLQIPYRIYRLSRGEPDPPPARSAWHALWVLGGLSLALIAVWGARQAGAIP